MFFLPLLLLLLIVFCPLNFVQKMAIELCSETSSSTMTMSPRISFSHDFSQADGVPIEQYIRSNSSSSVDFDFCVFRESFDHESSSADELFFDGKILPIEIKKKLGAPKKSSLDHPQAVPPRPPPYDDFYHSNARKISKNKNPREKTTMAVSESDEKHNSTESEEKQSSSSKSWFKRSSSLNCGSNYARSLCPLPLLSRSNSTGSTPNVKRSSLMKDNLGNKQSNLHKSASSSSSSSSSHHQKPPLKKSYNSYGSSNGSIKINPVLNVPTPTLFGLGSIFSTKNKKK